MESGVSIYPNPAADILNVNTSILESPVDARIVNALGQLVMIQKLPPAINQLDISGLSSGVYFIELTGPESNLVKREKFVKR